MAETSLIPADVAKALADFPPDVEKRLRAIRKVILDVAASTPEIGPLQECLKWGEPAYLPVRRNVGSTVRLGWNGKTPDQCRLYFICSTSLIEEFRMAVPESLGFEGNRAVLIPLAGHLPRDAISFCVRKALTYHLRRRDGGHAA